MLAKQEALSPICPRTQTGIDRCASPARWTDLPLNSIEVTPHEHSFLLDFSRPAARHLHSPSASIIRGSSQIDLMSDAIRQTCRSNTGLVFPEQIGKVKFLGMLNKGDAARITVRKKASADDAIPGGADYQVQMSRITDVDSEAGGTPSTIMNGVFSVRKISAAAIGDLPEYMPLNAAHGFPHGAGAGAEGDDALRRMKASAPANEHLQQIVSLRQIGKMRDDGVDSGEAIEAVIAVNPGLLTRIDAGVHMLSVGNLIQTCYQIPKIYLFSRSSLSGSGFEFYARHIAESSFRPVIFRGDDEPRLLLARIDVNRIKAVEQNAYCSCIARISDGSGYNLAVIHFSFLLDRSTENGG